MAASEVLPDTRDPDTEGFWAAAREQRLVVQTCAACGTARFPPRPYCGECRSATVGWEPVSGYARVWTYAFAYKPMLPAFEAVTPFPIVYVELEDHPGLRMAGNLVLALGQPINSVPQERVRVGLRVKVVFERMAEDVMLPRWMPVED
jgi:uncharacterized OB-fold protein